MGSLDFQSLLLLDIRRTPPRHREPPVPAPLEPCLGLREGPCLRIRSKRGVRPRDWCRNCPCFGPSQELLPEAFEVLVRPTSCDVERAHEALAVQQRKPS